jgi:Tol biopolymer transport system component
MKRDGPRPLDVAISDAGKSWRVDQTTPAPNGGCDQDGRADLPAWSPDGGTIAFVGSPKSIGLKGQARLSAPWNLYLLNPVDLKLKKALAELSGPSGLAWSPDSRWLAFSGELDHSGGLWLYQIASGKVVRIDTAQPGLLAWSPDGRQLAAIESVGPEPAKGDFFLYSVASVTH